jgi:hypothetical protein
LLLWVHPHSSREFRGKGHGRIFILQFPGENTPKKAKRRSRLWAAHSFIYHQSFIYSLIIHLPHPSIVHLLTYSFSLYFLLALVATDVGLFLLCSLPISVAAA